MPEFESLDLPTWDFPSAAMGDGANFFAVESPVLSDGLGWQFSDASVSSGTEFYGPPAPTQEQLGQQIVADAAADYRATLGNQWQDTRYLDLPTQSVYLDVFDRAVTAFAPLANAALNAGFAPSVRTPGIAPRSMQPVGVAMSGARPTAKPALFDKINQTGFGSTEVLVGGLVLIGAAYGIARLTQ